MARKINPKKTHAAIAVVVDGKDEKWYINKVKEHYPCHALKTLKIKPDLPERKKVRELFDFAKSKLTQEYTYVILVLDMDAPMKDTKEFAKFKELFEKYLCAHNNTLTGRQKTNYGWMKDMLLIVNNPCLEYWYLLHFRKTTKYYADFAALCPDLRRIPELSQYEKCEDYYNGHPNIYERLAQNNGLENARKNAIQFDINTCKNQGVSEMYLMFDYFNSL